MKLSKLLLIGIPILLTAILIANSKITIAENNCNDIIFIFARGSGEKLNGINYTEFKNRIEENISDSSLKYDFYELGSSEQNGYQYPAIAIGFDTFDHTVTTIGAKVSAGNAYTFGDSVKTGEEELRAYIGSINSTCKNTKFVLGGYSQGGLVLSNAIKNIDADKIIYTATLGDPKLYLPEGYGDNPDACHGKNLSPYRAYVPDCKTYQGLLGQNNPYQPTGYENKLGAWCNYLDIMCSKNFFILNPIKGHVSYISDGLYDKLAKVINNKLAENFPDKLEKVEVNLSTHDVAILIDSTGSMSGLIEKYKAEALRLAKEAIEMDGRIALYEYRDLSDPFEPVQHCSFETCTLETFEEELNSIKTSGGGDALESAMSASLKVLDTEKWKLGATKTIVLLTDAGYHPIDIDKVSFHQVVRRSLEIDPVNFYIITPPNNISNYTELAEATGGKVFSSVNEIDLSTIHIMERPTAILNNTEYKGLINDEIVFDASSSFSSSKIVSYEWDLDGDGIFESISETPIISKTYSEPINSYIQIKITDENGLFSTMSAPISIIEAPNAATTTLKINETIENDNSITINFSSDAEKTFLVINDTFLGELTEKTFTITDLNTNINNQISLIPYSANGKRGEIQTLHIDAKNIKNSTIKAPNSGTAKIISNLNANDRQTHIYKRQDP